METVENKYITLAYKLYTIENGEKEFTEEAPAEHPFQFISGLGLTLESFENQVKDLNKGDNSTLQSKPKRLTASMTRSMSSTSPKTSSR